MSLLTGELAPQIAVVVRANLTTRYPYHDDKLFEAGEPPFDPIAAHPAFGNAFDWHSSVHSHWTALQLLERGFVALEEPLVQNLRAENVAAEAAYLKGHPSYERPYGWAWALLLAAAAQNSSLATLRACTAELRALGEWIAASAMSWLARLPLPIRHGVHSNTAFAMGLMRDACEALRLAALERAIDERARAWFAGDREWPARWERSGHDFLSPALAEADLLRRVLPAADFLPWWRAFLPGISRESPLFAEASVPDETDGQIVHLHGLNLSRAQALANLAAALDDWSLFAHARRLYEASAARAVTGSYSERHWLPTFAWRAAAAIDDAAPRLTAPREPA